MPRPRPIRLLLAPLLPLLLLALGAADAPPCDLRPAARQARQSLVEVTARLSVDGLPVDLPEEHSVCRNTGFFIGRRGRVLTSVLGIAGDSTVTVRTADGRRATGRVIALDQASGVALLETDIEDSVPLTLREGPVEAGVVLALAGCSGDDASGPALRVGLVSATDAIARVNGIRWNQLLLVSVPAPAGSAAGPLLDAEGRLAGVVLAIRSGGADRLTYALPPGELAPLLARLEEGQSRRLGWLGVSVVSEEGELEGARVADVLENSPAHRAGILPGDVLLQIGDAPLSGPQALARVVADRGPRQGVPFRVLRGEELRTGTVDIEARPLLICRGAQRPGEARVRLHGGQPVGPGEATNRRLDGLTEENRRLRQRVRELEERLEAAGQAIE